MLSFANIKLPGLDTSIAKITILAGAIKLLTPALIELKNKIMATTDSLSKNSIQMLMNTEAIEACDKATKKQILSLLSAKGAYNKNNDSLSKNTKAAIKNTLIKSGMSKADAKVAVATIAETSATKGLTAATWGQVAAQKALQAAKSMSLSLLASAAIEGAIKLVSKLIEVYKEGHKTAEEVYNDAKEEYDEIQTELDDINSQLEETANRIDELNSEDSLSFIEKSELDKLKDTTKELIKQQKLLKEKEEKAQKEKEKAADAAAESDLNSNVKYKTTKKYVKDTSFLTNFNKNNLIPSSDNTLNFNYQTKELETYLSALEELKNKYKDNKDLVSQIDAEINRVKTDSNATNDVEVNVSTSLKKAAETNVKSYQDYTKQIEENKNKIKEYQKQVEEYEEKNPLVKQSETLGMTPQFEVGSQESQDYFGYKAAQEQIKKLQEEQDNLNKKRTTAKDNLKDEQTAYENILTNEEYRNDLSDEELQKLYEQYELILKISDPNKYKDMKFTDFMSDDDNKDAANQLLSLKDAGKVTAKQIKELAKEFPEFNNYLTNTDTSAQEAADQLNSMTGETEALLKAQIESVDSWSDTMSNLQSQYDTLTSAVDEYNNSGYISGSTMKSLVDSGVLQYLEWENGQLVANTGALYDNADAAKILALTELQTAYAKDVLAITTGDLTDASETAKNIIKGEKDEMDGLGDIAKAQAKGLFTLATAEAAAGDPEAVAAKAEQINKLNDAYNNMAKTMTEFDYSSARVTRYSGSSDSSGSSSSSSSSKEWWEEELDNLKDQFDYSEITINEYINGLQALLNKTEEGSEAWKKINKELQKQRLDKVKDDYDAGRISLTQYINELKNLQKAYKAGTDAWNDLADAIKDAQLDLLKEQQSDLEAALSAVNNLLDDQIDKYEEAKDAADEKYDDEIEKLEDLQEELEEQDDNYQRAQQAVLDYLNEQLDALNEQKDSVEEYYDTVIDAIEKMNEEQSESIELAEAYESLMNAMTQKSKKVKYMLSIKIAQNGETPEKDNPVGKIYFKYIIMKGVELWLVVKDTLSKNLKINYLK